MRGRLSGPQARSLTPKDSRPSKASDRLTYLRTTIEGFSRPADTDVLDDEAPSATTGFPTTPRPSQRPSAP